MCQIMTKMINENMKNGLPMRFKYPIDFFNVKGTMTELPYSPKPNRYPNRLNL